MTKQDFLEEIKQSSNLKVDRDKGIIFGVKLLGPKSKNGHEYLSEAMQRAVPLYNNLQANVDHVDRKNPRAERKVKDRFGKYQDAKFVEGEGIFADLHYLKSHADAELICEAAERMPDVLGLSHHASGDTKKGKDGKTLIHSITSVRSVDIVADPATTKGLFEAATMDAPAPAPTIEEAFQMLQVAVMAKDGDDLSNLKQVLKLKSKILGTTTSETPEEEEPAADDAQESEEIKAEKKERKLLEAKVKLMEKKDLARSLCAAAKITADSELVEALILQADEDKMKAHIEWVKKISKPTSAGRKPVSSGGYQLRESEEKAPEKIPTEDPAKLAAWVRT